MAVLLELLKILKQKFLKLMETVYMQKSILPQLRLQKYIFTLLRKFKEDYADLAGDEMRAETKEVGE